MPKNPKPSNSVLPTFNFMVAPRLSMNGLIEPVAPWFGDSLFDVCGDANVTNPRYL